MMKNSLTNWFCKNNDKNEDTERYSAAIELEKQIGK